MQYRLKFIRVLDDRRVLLKKIPDGWIGELLNLFNIGGTEFEADERELREIRDEAARNPSHPNYANNDNEMAKAITALHMYKQKHR